jgi:predicted RecB family nuclease
MHLRAPALTSASSLRLFPTDLTNFLACRHMTALERLAAHGLARRPHYDDPMLELLRERGLAHESAYVAHLAAAGKRVVEIDRHSKTAADDTLAAMRSGADVIVQARLEHGAWAGWADVLLRAPGESALGAFRYEPVETKLAKETRGSTLVQLCVYAELLTTLQGGAPEHVHVVVPHTDFEPEHYRFDEFRSYVRLAQRRFEEALEAPLASSLATAAPYPDCRTSGIERRCDGLCPPRSVARENQGRLLSLGRRHDSFP